MARKVISLWAKKGNRPKIADLGVDDEKVEQALKSSSLAEAFGYKEKRSAVVNVTPQLFARMLAGLRA